MELLSSMIAEAEGKLNGLGLNSATLENDLASLEQTRITALAEYERARLEISGLESTLAQQANELHEVRARQEVVKALRNRFELLDKHYEADLGRLRAIEESGSLLEALPSRPCPVCGAPPDEHRADEAEVSFNPSAVQLGARREAAKITGLRGDLRKLLAELTGERNVLETRGTQATTELNTIQERLDKELTPRVKESAETLASQNLRRDSLLQGKSIIEQLARLRAHQNELAGAPPIQPNPTAAVVSAPTTADIDAFAAVVQSVLVSWRYPEPGRVVFSEEAQDLVIAGQPRINHGKGVRALTCAAFIVGLLRHCRNKSLPHPSVVLLDSPLVAYREPDSPGSEAEKLRHAGVKEAFYSSLAAGEALGQVIVFENEDPPANLKGATMVHFTKGITGRYGFFPKP